MTTLDKLNYILKKGVADDFTCVNGSHCLLYSLSDKSFTVDFKGDSLEEVINIAYHCIRRKIKRVRIIYGSVKTNGYLLYRKKEKG